tara:strand:- start:7833 stop:9200 length:1368 start_codon:yes stop_codon:yes gene_type:complete
MIANVKLSLKPDHATSEVIASWNMEKEDKGAIAWNSTLQKNVSWNGSIWNGVASQLNGRIIVTQDNFQTTLGGTIDSTKQYFLDGVIDMGTTQITVPVNGMTIAGLSFDISGLKSTEDNYTMFVSESPAIGSGNLLGFDYLIDVSGVNSKVYELYDATGFNAFEFIRINYNNCTSLGNIYNYRQGLENGTGRFGGSPSLTLNGLWRGGFRITTSITRGMSNTTTEPLFKAGTAFQMNSRFLTDMNVDLGTLQPFLDFAPVNFPNPSTLQLKGTIITRGGVSDSSNINITPNINNSDLASDWDGNSGLSNTFIGGLKDLIVETETVLLSANTQAIILGTWVDSDLQHFDSNFNYSLRHLGVDPRNFRVTFDFVLRGLQDNQYRVSLKKNSGGIITTEYGQTRTIDRLAGLRDVSYFNGVFGLEMQQYDFVYWVVENLTTATSCTLEIDSQWFIEER